MKKILVVQDSPSIALILRLRLEAEGFFVDIAETGEEGVEKAKANEYQLILLDYNLPGINGIEVCRALKKDEKIKNIPMLFMSASDEDKLDSLIKGLGSQGYIKMPFDKDEFITVIKKYL